jgi:hypothetical protein
MNIHYSNYLHINFRFPLIQNFSLCSYRRLWLGSSTLLVFSDLLLLEIIYSSGNHRFLWNGSYSTRERKHLEGGRIYFMLFLFIIIYIFFFVIYSFAFFIVYGGGRGCGCWSIGTIIFHEWLWTELKNYNQFIYIIYMLLLLPSNLKTNDPNFINNKC